VIVTHSSGVTERKSEIEKYRGFNSRQKSDFSSNQQIFVSKENSLVADTPSFRAYLKTFLLRTGLLSTCNNDIEFEKIKPWVLSVRGHYTFMFFEPSLIKKLFEMIVDHASQPSLDTRTIGVQYRLGDLLTLESKSPIPAERIANKIKEIENFSDLGITICSDSLILATELITEHLDGEVGITPVDLAPDETLIALSKTVEFVGTTSKLSIWAAVFRSIVYNLDNSYLPEQFKPEIHSHGLDSQIRYYS